jgi:hypothetical protein
MTADTGEGALGGLEGRIVEQSALLHQLHADLTAGLQSVNVRIDQVNGRIDKLLLAIGGGILASLIGIIAALVVLIVRGG